MVRHCSQLENSAHLGVKELKRVSFLTYDTADDIITSFEIIEKLLFSETDFWHDNYLKAMD